MPKKRRNRRNKKQAINNQKVESEAEIVSTPIIGRDKSTLPPSISITNILSPIKATPSPKINNNAVKLHEVALPTTPVNREKSYRGKINQKINEQLTPNFSNINLLFHLENSAEIKPARVNVATQTGSFRKIVITRDVAVQYEENVNIMETPKINQFLNDEKLQNFDHNHVLQKNNVLLRSCNVNPYLKTNTEATEVSFFTSHFYDLKTASTPIERMYNYGKYTPKNDIQTLRNEMLALKRCYKSASPKINRYVTHKKHCNKSHNISFLRQSSPIKTNVSAVCRRITIEEGDEVSSITDTIVAGLFVKLKKFGRFTAQWTMKFIEICCELGITIRKGLSEVYKYYKKEETIVENTPRMSCQCNQFKAEINTLTEKIDQLAHEIEQNKKLTEDNQISNEKFLRDFNELKERLIALEEMKSDVQEMKKKLNCGQMVPPPPSLPPPPPPPPPPTFNLNSNPLKISARKSLREEKIVTEGVSRPIISLDDILKVKLKKTTRERSTPTLRTVQPAVSMEMLKQVKLRPSSSRSHTPGSLREDTPSGFSTSPHSSLTRMLSNVDANVYKVKRLKRVSPYSFNDISRRNHLARLDRDRTN